ncbi:MAG: branched-chain amino acid ABC transporter permease [Hyphomicrobiales bacterium]|nr:branched-chain amino acid ABC transporter permease [Hyphomicrobiales bacterium]
MTAFLNQCFSGLAMGGIFAILALSLVMIFQATALLNFAQGEMAMASTYLAWQLIQHRVPYWLAFFLTVILSFAAGVLIERLIIRRFASAPVLTVVIVFIALVFIIDSVVGWIFGYQLQEFPSPFPDHNWFNNPLVSSHQSGILLVTLIVMAVVWAFFRFTTLGLAMRAAAQNPASSRLVGIKVGWMLALGWGLAAAIGSIAGMMAAPLVYLDPSMMSSLLLYGFAGAVLGGINNPWGAVLGGLIVGVSVNLVGAYLVGTQLQLAVALTMIIGVLLVRPSGLFGRTIVTRV